MSKLILPIVLVFATALSNVARAEDDATTQPSQQETPTETTTITPPAVPTSSTQVVVAPILPPVVVVEKNELPPAASAVKATTVVKAQPKPRYRWAVVDLSCGVPSGCVGELGIRPFYWLKLEVGAGYNGMSPGVIGTVVLDPIPWAIGLTASADVGHYWSGNIPFVNNPPQVEYSWADLMGGLEFGNYRAWRLYFRGGITWLSGNVSNIDYGSNNNGATFGSPQINIVASPAIKIGVSIYF